MTAEDESPAEPPLVVVRGDATEEEVAALTAVVAAIGVAGASAAERPPAPVSQWASRARQVRGAHAMAPGAWRASGLPR